MRILYLHNDEKVFYMLTSAIFLFTKTVFVILFMTLQDTSSFYMFNISARTSKGSIVITSNTTLKAFVYA